MKNTNLIKIPEKSFWLWKKWFALPKEAYSILQVDYKKRLKSLETCAL